MYATGKAPKYQFACLIIKKDLNSLECSYSWFSMLSPPTPIFILSNKLEHWAALQLVWQMNYKVVHHRNKIICADLTFCFETYDWPVIWYFRHIQFAVCMYMYMYVHVHVYLRYPYIVPTGCSPYKFVELMHIHVVKVTIAATLIRRICW